MILGRPCQKEVPPLKLHIGRLKMGARISTVNHSPFINLCLEGGKIQLYGTDSGQGQYNSSSPQIQLSTNHILFRKILVTLYFQVEFKLDDRLLHLIHAKKSMHISRFQTFFLNLWKFLPLSFFLGTHTYIDGTKKLANMKKRLRFQMPHVPLKVLRGQQDEEDIQDQLYERFQAPPGTTTEEEAERAAADNESRTSHSSHEDITSGVGEVSEEGTGKSGSGLDRSVGSIHSIRQSDNASDEGAEDVHSDHIDLNNTGYQTTGSVSHEAIELQAFADVHQRPDTEGDTTINTDNTNNTGSGVASIPNVSEEATGRYLGRHTSSIDNVSQSDTASDEAIELQGFAQVHHPPNTESDVASISNISEEIMQRYLGEHTGSQHSASQSDNASHEGVGNVHNDQINNTGYEATGRVSDEDIEMQVLPQTHQPPNTDNDDSDVL